MSNSHEPPYVRLDDKGLEKVFDKMKSFASKKSLEQVADRVPSKQKQEYWDNKADKSDIPPAIVPDISASATVDSTSSPNPSVEVVKTGTDEEPSFAFNFHGIRGSEGPEGPSGRDGSDGVSPDVSIETITDGHRVTITDKDHPAGQSFDVMDGQDGSAGQPGVDGVSPTVAITTITDGHTVTITDKDHPSGQSFNVMDGSDGSAGPSGADGVSPAVTITSITGGHEVKITDKDHPTGQTFNVMDGSDGATGPAGPGVPSGGTAGQVLSKVDGTDYNTAWTTPSGGGGTTIPYISTWDSGSTNTIWKATVSGYTAYTNGDMFLIKPKISNYTNVYININGLGNKYLYSDTESYNKIESLNPVLIIFNGSSFNTVDSGSAKKVLQLNATVANDYRVLLSYSANDTKNAGSVNKSSKLTFNPYYGKLTVGGELEANSVGTNLAAAIRALVPGGGGQRVFYTSEYPTGTAPMEYNFTNAYLMPSGLTPTQNDLIICVDGYLYIVSSVSGGTTTSYERYELPGGGSGGGGNVTRLIGELLSQGGGSISSVTAYSNLVLTVDLAGDNLPLSTFQVLIYNQQGNSATLNPIAYKVETQYNQIYSSLEEYFRDASPYTYDRGFVHLFFQTATNFLVKASFEFEVSNTDEITFTGSNASYQQVFEIL